MHSRKSLIAFSMSVLITVCASAQDRLTVVSWGGAYGSAQKQYMIDPYTKKTGVEILFTDYSGGVAEMKAQVEANRIVWDAVDIEAIDLERACSEGYLEVLDFDDLPPGDDGVAATEDFFPDALASECGVGVIYWGTIYAYRDDANAGSKPSTIADFFDTKAFPGKRGMRKRPQVNMEWALLADGVPKDKVYEVLATDAGQQRAFAKLDSLKSDSVWFDSWSQAPQLLADGGAVMVQSANGRIYSAIVEENQPFEIVWDGFLFDLDVWSILHGSANKAAAWDFIKFATGTVPLAGMQEVAYGPTRRSSASHIDAEVQSKLPTAHLDEGMRANAEFWADYGESLGEKFNQWLLLP
ncbi:MAG: ABC transporter substrate-binding protein [Pseudomonadota bacterium]